MHGNSGCYDVKRHRRYAFSEQNHPAHTGSTTTAQPGLSSSPMQPLMAIQFTLRFRAITNQVVP